MKNKYIWITLFLFIIVTLTLFLRGNEDTWLCTEVGWIQHGKPNSVKPIIPCGKIENEQAVEKYLIENISNISPQKEVLGGKFYITKINWLENNSGTVEYEDGHIALKASFDYEIKTNRQDNDYSVIITNFKIGV